MKISMVKILMLCCSIFVINTLYAETGANISTSSLQISSDTIYQDKHQLIYAGNVVITQGKLVLHADKGVVENNNPDEIKQNKITLSGQPATFEQKFAPAGQVNGSARTLHYEPKLGRILLDGNVLITQKNKTLQNKSILYDLNTHDYTSISNE